MERASFDAQYAEAEPKYKALGAYLQAELKQILEKAEVSCLEVQFRVKKADSAYKKVGEKEINEPFVQMEDWCALRIICYYEDDIARISKLLNERLAIRKKYDVANRLGQNEVGYRSTHFILTIKPDQALGEYESLQDVIAEVQVRTILMHAWAEIEHKLQYKSGQAVPSEFRRKLALLSAKFEETDQQFVDIRKGLTAYREALKKLETVDGFRDSEMNLDIILAFSKVAFPDVRYDATGIELNLFPQLVYANMTMPEIIEGYKAGKAFIPSAQKFYDERYHVRFRDPNNPFIACQSHAMMAALLLGSDIFYNAMMIAKPSPQLNLPPIPWLYAMHNARGPAQVIRKENDSK